MKKLTLKHVFKMAKIVKTGDLKEKLSTIAVDNENKTKVGADLIFTVFEACADDKVQKQLYELLDDVFESKTEDMSLDDVFENFKQLAKENNLLDFFRSAGALTN